MTYKEFKNSLQNLWDQVNMETGHDWENIHGLEDCLTDEFLITLAGDWKDFHYVKRASKLLMDFRNHSHPRY